MSDVYIDPADSLAIGSADKFANLFPAHGGVSVDPLGKSRRVPRLHEDCAGPCIVPVSQNPL